MRNKRMFSADVVDTDRFLEMPLTAQALYFHLGMRADDDGFISSPKRTVRSLNAADDDFKLLIAKGYLIPFESGVVVITHWKQNNYIRPDRYVPTRQTGEYALLNITDDCYKLTDSSGMLPHGIPTDNHVVDPKENSKEENKKENKRDRATPFTPPSLEDVKAYCDERGNGIDPEHFIDHYTANGWMTGRTKMKDWKATVRNWERNEFSKKQSKPSAARRDDILDAIF